MSLRNTIGAIAALLLSFIIPVVAAAGPLAMTLATSKRKFDVTIYPSPGTASRPVVLVFSGAKGYEAAAYHRLAEDLNFAGIDVAVIQYLSEQDTTAIEHASSARARIAFYAKRMPDWVETARVTIATLRNQPRYQSKIGILGISLGSMPATSASANNRKISASAIVDGGFPPNFNTTLNWMPPLLMVWGGDDRVFSLGSATALKNRIHLLGGPVELQVFPDEGHAFFLEDRNPDADQAKREIVKYFSRYLR